MPELDDVTDEQLLLLERYASIYAGNPWRASWRRFSFQLPLSPAELLNRIGQGGPLSVALSPKMKLGNRQISFDRPIVQTRVTVQLREPVDKAEPGALVTVVPGENSEMILAAVVDWKRGSAGVA